MDRTQTYQVPTSTGKTKNDIIPVPIIVNGTNTHNSGDVAKQGSVRFNALGIIPFAKKLFSKKKEPAPAPRKPLPEGELVISFYDTSKVLLEEKTLKLSEINSWETLSFSTKAEEKGYVSAYIQGKSAKPVSFDNFQIKTRATYTAKLYQENHYYPFGMNMKGLESSDKQSVQNKAAHEFQFNAQTEREESFGLFWDETPFRNYDMQLGRLWGVDLLAEAFSDLTPFHYAYNNPIDFNDPTGLASESGFKYDWDTGQYKNQDGKVVEWNVVHTNLQESGKTQSVDFNFTNNGDGTYGTYYTRSMVAGTDSQIGVQTVGIFTIGGNNSNSYQAGFGNDISFGVWGYAAGFTKWGGYITKYNMSKKLIRLGEELPGLRYDLAVAQSAYKKHYGRRAYLATDAKTAAGKAFSRIKSNLHYTRRYTKIVRAAKNLSRKFLVAGFLLSGVDQIFEHQDYKEGKISEKKYYTNTAFRIADLGVATAAFAIGATSPLAPVVIGGAAAYFAGRFVYDLIKD